MKQIKYWIEHKFKQFGYFKLIDRTGKYQSKDGKREILVIGVCTNQGSNFNWWIVTDETDPKSRWASGSVCFYTTSKKLIEDYIKI
jgi:hypothetical protein